MSKDQDLIDSLYSILSSNYAGLNREEAALKIIENLKKSKRIHSGVYDEKTDAIRVKLNTAIDFVNVKLTIGKGNGNGE